jgi:hypothetical protein
MRSQSLAGTPCGLPLPSSRNFLLDDNVHLQSIKDAADRAFAELASVFPRPTRSWTSSNLGPALSAPTLTTLVISSSTVGKALLLLISLPSIHPLPDKEAKGENVVTAL